MDVGIVDLVHPPGDAPGPGPVPVPPFPLTAKPSGHAAPSRLLSHPLFAIHGMLLDELIGEMKGFVDSVEPGRFSEREILQA